MLFQYWHAISDNNINDGDDDDDDNADDNDDRWIVLGDQPIRSVSDHGGVQTIWKDKNVFLGRDFCRQ